jgi:CheY-like chemotaxis protein
MTFLVVLLLIAVFIGLDFAIRTYLHKREEDRHRQTREHILRESLTLDFTHEAKSLKRVSVPEPKARILAVDDEETILGSFRKILVMDGYSVDTVETGQEALGLIQKHHYDFVFTDLKMPAMSGVEVCRQVKQLRPDIDVIIITGYASVQSAVETMKDGAMDYIEKPFTEDELTGMVNQFRFKREERLRRRMKNQVNLTHSVAEARDTVPFSIPGGVFIAPGHTWAALEPKGTVQVGMDDFAVKVIGQIDNLTLPNTGLKIAQGEPLFSLKQGQHTIRFAAPLSGTVVKVNERLREDKSGLTLSPYGKNWVCVLEPEDLEGQLNTLKLGQSAVQFFNEDIERLYSYVQENVEGTKDEEQFPLDGHVYLGQLEALKEQDYQALIQAFFHR